jgi:hypothetical protein
MAFDWYLQRRYSFLLLALALLFVVHTFVLGVVGTWLYDALLTLVFLATFPLLFKRQGYLVAGVLLGVPTIVANWTGYALPGVPAQPLAVAFHLFAAVFLSLTVVAILQSVHEAKAVTFDSLAGAFGGYLIAGLIFSHLYTAVEWITPGSFRMPADLTAQLADAHQRRLLFNYFSFTTLTTVGYGDITPVTQPARSLTSLEAVVGQFYIAVVMAELIGLKVSQERGGNSDPDRP